MAQKAEIASHEVNRTVGNILNLIESDRMTDRLNEIDTASRAGIQRIEHFTRQLREQLNASSDIDVSTNGLTTIQSNLQNTWTELNGFVSNGQPSAIINALANLDGAISTASWTFFKRSIRGSRAYGESIGTVEQQAQASIKRVSDQADAVSNRLEAISQNSEGLLNQAELAAQTVEESRSKITTDIEEIRTEFTALRTDLESKVDSQLALSNQKADQFLEKKENEASEFIERLIGLENQAKTIVQIIGNVGVTGNYQNRATSEATSENFWRWATIGLFGIGVFLVIVNIILNFAGKIDLNLLLARFAIAVSVSLPAIYTARESARHRSNADQSKQTELELASLGPFLQNLPAEQQQEITKNLAPVYFGRISVAHVVEAPVDLNKLVEVAVKAARFNS